MRREKTEVLFAFQSPLSMRETREALVAETIHKTAQPTRDGRLATMGYEEIPPLEADVYFSTVNDDYIVVTAGNRVETFWRVEMAFQPLVSGGVAGEVRLDRRIKDVRQWMGNVQEMAFLFGGLQRKYSFHITKRKY